MGLGRPKKVVKALFFQTKLYNDADSGGSRDNGNSEVTLASETRSSTNPNFDIDNKDDGTY